MCWSRRGVVIGSVMWCTGSQWGVGVLMVRLSLPCDRFDGVVFFLPDSDLPQCDTLPGKSDAIISELLVSREINGI